MDVLYLAILIFDNFNLYIIMQQHFEHLLQIRHLLKNQLLGTSLEDLAYVPDGFNNTLFWNIAHCVATQQLLIYFLSGTSFRVDSYWVEHFKKGTLPQLSVRDDEVEDLAYLLIRTAEIMVDDYDNKYFQHYKNYTTSLNIEVKNFEDALQYNIIHESLHLGYCMALQKALIGEKLKYTNG